MPTMHRLGLALMGVLLMAGSAAAAETTLRWKFEKGAELPYVISREFDAAFDLDGNQFDLQLAMILDTTSEVRKVEDGVAELVLKVTRVQVNSTSLIMNLEFDSATGEKPEGQAAAMLGPLETLLASEISVKVDTMGKLHDVTLPEDLIEALTSDGDGNRGARSLFSAFSLGEEAIREMLERVFVAVPEGAVAQDVAWQQSLERKFGRFGVQTFEMKFGGAGSGDKGEKATIASTVFFEPADDPDLEFDAEITEQDAEGEFHFDADKGRLEELVLEQQMVMDILAGGRNIIQDITETIEIRVGSSPPPAEKPAEEASEEPAESEE